MGAISGAISAAAAGPQEYGSDIGNVYPARTCPYGGDNDCRSASAQGGVQIAALMLTLALALIGGALAGMIAKALPAHTKMPEGAEYNDKTYWEVEEEENHAQQNLEEVNNNA